jgi:hypothetical protein
MAGGVGQGRWWFGCACWHCPENWVGQDCRAVAEFEVFSFKFEAGAGLESWDSRSAREDTRPTPSPRGG